MSEENTQHASSFSKEQANQINNYPLMGALSSRRSRRFAPGLEIDEGPFKYKSADPPQPLSEAEEAALVYDPQHGLGWKDSHGWDVFFGVKGDDIPSKIVVYKAIAKQLQADGTTPVLINVEHIHAPYYRLEQ